MTDDEREMLILQKLPELIIEIWHASMCDVHFQYHLKFKCLCREEQKRIITDFYREQCESSVSNQTFL